MTEPVRIGTGAPTRNYDIAPALLERARALPVEPGTTDRRYPVVDEQGAYEIVEEKDAPCIRCKECGDMIFPDDFQARLGHLFTHHGWRMNGKRYDNHNNVIEEA